MSRVRSVNLGVSTTTPHAIAGRTGIDKRPVTRRVRLVEPGPRGSGASGVVGDCVVDLEHHGGTDQAVYAYAREDLDAFEALLHRDLPCGVFGENLTTSGVDVTGARIGEHWRVGSECLLQVSSPRIPCRTFAGWLEAEDWVRRFIAHGAPGAYLRVIEPGEVGSMDEIEVVSRPDHSVTIGECFAAMTHSPERLHLLLEARDALPAPIVARARRALSRHAPSSDMPLID